MEISVVHRIKACETPELRSMLGITSIKVFAEHEAVGMLANQPEVLHDCLRMVLGMLQRRAYREMLIPPLPGGAPHALVGDFPLQASGEAIRLVLEFIPARRGGGHLRLTLENPRGRHLDLKSMPHVQIRDFDARTFIAGST